MRLYQDDFEKVRAISPLFYRLKKKIPRANVRDLKLFYPRVSIFAISIHIALGINIKRATSLAKRYISQYNQWDSERIAKAKAKGIYSEPWFKPSRNNLGKEFRARGFKRTELPIDEFLKARKLPRKGAYIISNHLVNGYLYVYPVTFAHSIGDIKKGWEYVYKPFGLIAIPGHTKIKIYD